MSITSTPTTDKKPTGQETVFDRIRREEKERKEQAAKSSTEELARRLQKAGSM